MSIELREEKLNSNPNHIREVTDFECSLEDEALVEYLKNNAFSENKESKTRTYLIKNNENIIIGYYSLRTYAISIDVDGFNRIKPLIELSEFAIDWHYQRNGYGTAIMINYVFDKLFEISEIIGCEGIITFAKDAKAISFYKKLGFEELDLEEEMIMPRDAFSDGCTPMLVATESISAALE